MSRKRKKHEPIKTYYLVRDFLNDADMAQSVFGKTVVGDPNLFRRLKEGGDIGTRQDAKIRNYISKYRENHMTDFLVSEGAQ